MTSKTDKETGKRTYTLDFEFKFYDMYNWDKGKATPVGGVTITDDMMQQFHRQGYAREYEIVGTYRSTVTWP